MKKFVLVVAVLSAFAAIFVPSASALAFADQPCVETHPASGIVLVCPAGTVGAGYSQQLAVKGGDLGGNGPPFTYILRTGALPPGLSLTSSGLISGVPTTAGTASFGIELQDNPGGCAGCGCVNRGTCAFRDFSITIGPGLSLSKDSRPVGTIGVAYSNQIAASLVTSPSSSQPASNLSWSVASGALPPGIALGANDGVLSGTPTTEGSFTFTVMATGNGSDTETYTIVVRTPVLITPVPLTWAGKHGSEIGIAIDAHLVATGGTGTFTWALAGGAPPTGVTIGPDGTIAGTPKLAGSYVFTAQVTDSEGRTATVNLSVKVAAKLSIKTIALKTGKVGRAYSFKLKTLGGALPVKWTILRGTLPKGLHFGKKLGVFLGKPKLAGTYRVTVEAVDGYGIKAHKTLVLVVKA